MISLWYHLNILYKSFFNDLYRIFTLVIHLIINNNVLWYYLIIKCNNLLLQYNNYTKVKSNY